MKVTFLVLPRPFLAEEEEAPTTRKDREALAALSCPRSTSVESTSLELRQPSVTTTTTGVHFLGRSCRKTCYTSSRQHNINKGEV